MRPAGRYLLSFALTVVSVMGLYVIAFLFQVGAPVSAEYWLHDVIIVKRHIANAIPERKLVILGGSASLFGYDSAHIEHATGVRTVNLALHGGLSLDYLVAYARPLLRRGDTVLLTLEYEFYARGDYPSWFTSNVMAWDPEYFWRLPFMEKVDFASGVSAARVTNGVFAQVLRQRLHTSRGRGRRESRVVLSEMKEMWKDTSDRPRLRRYSFRRLNRHGDIQGNQGSSLPENYARPALQVHDDAPVWDDLRAFSEECKTLGVRLFIGWPPVPARDAPAMYAIMDRVHQYVKGLGIVTVGNPRDRVHDERFFFDMFYHLNEDGRRIQTTKLVSDLKEKL
jgi:hypothetical protein